MRVTCSTVPGGCTVMARIRDFEIMANYQLLMYVFDVRVARLVIREGAVILPETYGLYEVPPTNVFSTAGEPYKVPLYGEEKL